MTGSPYMANSDFAALKAYVQSTHTTMNQAESTVIVQVTHSHLRKTAFPEIRLDKYMSVETVKQRLSTTTGTSISSMVIQLKDVQGNLAAVLDDDSKLFGYYSPVNGCTMHVIDTDPTSLSATGWLEDTSKVEKYVMSDEEYNKRDNSYRKWKEEKVRQDPTWTLEKEMAIRRGQPYEAKPAIDADHLKDVAGQIQVGQRCSVAPGDRRGIVRYVGKVEEFAAGYWIGVQFDEPLGQGDGTAKGKVYYPCPKGFGSFVRPDKVTVGDFPPLDDGLGSDDEI